jgi:hypothetical protein
MTFWNRSGFESRSSDPYLWIGRIRMRVREAQKPYGSGSGFRSGTLVHLHHSSNIKSLRQNSWNQGFSCYFCLMGGSRVGFVLVANGSWSGSGRPENLSLSGSGTLKRSIIGPLPQYLYNQSVQFDNIQLSTLNRKREKNRLLSLLSSTEVVQTFPMLKKNNWLYR